jgi:acetyl esterase/lipase
MLKTSLLGMALAIAAVSPATEPLTVAEYVRSIHPMKADQRIAYGSAASQWADLYLPKGKGPHPVVVLIHGGCFSLPAGAAGVSQMAADLATHGVAVWNVEYRRLGEPGGGYPGTFQDVGTALDRLRAEAGPHDLDLKRVVVVGHSAGGVLALWAGSRARLPGGSPLHADDPLPVRTVVSLAGGADLKASANVIVSGCGMRSMEALVGAPSPERPDPYADTSPRALLPTGVRTVWIVGPYDDNYMPYMSLNWRRAATAAGDTAETVLIPDAGHFDVATVGRAAWDTSRARILAEVRRLR